MKIWRCTVCGYEQAGENPPEKCPICGVGPEEFVIKSTEFTKKNSTAKQWKCTVCDYIHTGDEPPASCPLCGVGREMFVLLDDRPVVLSSESILETDFGTLRGALTKISYGLYIITSIKENKINGMCANTVFQLTDDPPRIALCINKNNLTHEYIDYSGVFAISVLGREHMAAVRNFGYRSGRSGDKFVDVNYVLGKNGCPILQNCVAYLEGRIVPEKANDVGTHTLFVANVTSGKTALDEKPLTYAYYRQNKLK